MNRDRWIERALELGFEGFEIFESRSSDREVSWFEGKMDSFVESSMQAVSFRALKDGKMVSMRLESVTDEEMDERLNQLLEQAELIAETEQDIFPEPQEDIPVKSLHTWTRPDMDSILELLEKMEKDLLESDPRIVQVASLGWGDASSSKRLVNSNGVDASSSSAYQIISASVMAQEGEEVQDDYEIEIVHDLKDFDEKAFVSRLADKVLERMHASSMKTQTVPVILDNKAMTSLFTAFSPIFYGTQLARGISPLTGKIGEKIFSDKITVVDDPRNQQSVYLANFDDEGTLTRKKDVVLNGVFETPLHNTKSALKMGTVSTGNGFKSGAGATAVSGYNLYISPGSQSLAEMIGEMKDGVVITDLIGLHVGIQLVSGNFSLQAKGYRVRDGKKDQRLTLITLAGNFLDLMNRVVAVGNDLDWSYHSTAAPCIWFSEAVISGD